MRNIRLDSFDAPQMGIHRSRSVNLKNSFSIRFADGVTGLTEAASLAAGCFSTDGSLAGKWLAKARFIRRRTLRDLRGQIKSIIENYV
jgi:hypothetical protein